jgi:hypothetical protein
MRIALTAVAVFFLVATAATEASAEDGAAAKTGIGVGVEALLLTPPGVAVSYDADTWRLDGMVAFFENTGGEQIVFGGRVMFPIHASDRADFSVGGGLGLVNRDGGGGDNENDFHIEGSSQIRAFLTPNVAVVTSLGLGIVLTDGDDPFVVSGDLFGSVGVLYYFY